MIGNNQFFDIKKYFSIDLIASTTSFFCALHCLSVPVILSFSSLNRLYFLENENIEWIFISLSLMFALISLWPCYKKCHNKIRPLLLASIGFIFIGLGKIGFIDILESINTAIGATLICIAHYLNRILLKTL